MSDQTQIGAAFSGVAQAIATTAPQLVSASPKVAAVVAVAELAPIALSFLNSAATMHSIGGLTADQLAALFVSVGQGIQASHDKWAAMNKPAALNQVSLNSDYSTAVQSPNQGVAS